MNKYKITILILFIVCTFYISKVYSLINGYTLLGKTIYIDAGHGGIDSGTIYKDILEKDINLTISKKLEQVLTSYGATVYMTRTTDKDLSTTSIRRKKSDLINRAYLINKVNPDMYISIHVNYINDSKWKGLQIFYNNKNKENINIASNITSYLKEKTNNIREYKYNSSYYMYNNITSPGVLIEIGFLSNPEDRYRLTHENYQDILVDNLSYSIQKYFKEKT